MSKSNPKVHFAFSDKNEFVKFSLTIKVSTDFRFFYTVAELPTQLFQLGSAPFSHQRMYFTSFHDLKESVQDMCDEYEATMIEEQKTKVILYELVTDNGWRGISIKLIWEVLQNVTTTTKGVAQSRYYKEERVGRGTNTRLELYNHNDKFDKPLEMAWSQERENWFMSMDTKLEDLSSQIRLGFGKTPETLARRIDQGAQLQLGTGKADE